MGGAVFQVLLPELAAKHVHGPLDQRKAWTFLYLGLVLAHFLCHFRRDFRLPDALSPRNRTSFGSRRGTHMYAVVAALYPRSIWLSMCIKLFEGASFFPLLQPLLILLVCSCGRCGERRRRRVRSSELCISVALAQRGRHSCLPHGLE